MNTSAHLPSALGATARDDLSSLLRRAINWGRSVPADGGAPLERLCELEERLGQQRLHLAVLGQFKRGKSTLLNALLGVDVVPTGVLPITAIPTFLEAAATPGLTILYADGREDRFDFTAIEALRERLADLVTEEANPDNRLGLARVIVRLPSELLTKGVSLIDTPGVGSTHHHNTMAADAILPACDAALFVVSTDPPITEVEVSYLERIRPNVSHILIVLNKIDLLEPEDADRAEMFLTRALVEQAGLKSPKIFRVSARAGFQAKLVGDARALEASGLAALEQRLVELLGRDKRAVLEAAVSRKAVALIGELKFQAEFELKSLQLPFADLEQRQRVFEEAIAGFEDERRIVNDLLAADQRRALEVLDGEAEALRSKICRELGLAIDREVAEGAESAKVWRDLQPGLPQRFEMELTAAIERVRTQLEPIFQAHQGRAERLVDLVKRAAANVMELPLPAVVRADDFETRVLPYWVVDRPAELNPLPPEAFERFLPSALRERHARRRIEREIADLAMRNVENLRWAMRQNVQDAFRGFAGDVDERFASSLAATRGVMLAAIEMKSGYAAMTEARIGDLQIVIARLQEVAAGVTELLGAGRDLGGWREEGPSGQRP